MIIRRAIPADTIGMSEMLNQIIDIGGTTAFLDHVPPETIQSWMECDPDKSIWLVAVGNNNEIIGYQSTEPYKFSSDALNIATFARIGSVQSGIGSRLFEATKIAARDLGYAWINATIRADNTGGLRYYDSRGFETYSTDNDGVLTDGTVTGKVSKRFDL